MTDSENPVQAAITAWQQTSLTGAQLMREMVSYERWNVPISDAAAKQALRDNTMSRLLISEDEDGVKRLYIFSGADAYRTYQNETGDRRPQTFLSVAGSWLFQLPMDGVDYVAIDPFTDYNVAYGREHLERLALFARAVVVEHALADLRAGNLASEQVTTEMLKLLLNYRTYQLAFVQQADAASLAYAPDSQGRRLAAVFTHDDAFRAYASDARNGGVQSITLDGRTLFERLREAELGGIVFNCAGPAKPVAFALGIADVVLRSAGPHS